MAEIKIYSKEEVYEASLLYFGGDSLATDVWMNKYALKDLQGNYLELTPDDMHKRITKELARIENKYPNPIKEETIYNLLKDFKYVIPGGSNLYGIGNNFRLSSLGNCFVVGNEADSYGGIFQTDQEQTQLMKMRAGVGHDISHYRPKGVVVSNTAGTSVGIVPLMERFSNSTREVSQNGRRGALMLSISVNHPDVEEFIKAKEDLTKVTGANVSVKVTNEFVEAVNKDDDYYLKFPIDMKVPTGEYYDEIFSNLKYNELTEINNVYDSKNKLHKKGYVRLVKARKIWDLMMYHAHKSAEPGILFWDNIIKESPADLYEGFETTSTNPCGEIPLCPYDSCRLLSINLFGFINNPFTNESNFDIDLFKEVAYESQKLMDDIVDLEIEKVNKILSKLKSDIEENYIKFTEINLWENILEKLRHGRRTGLSVIGVGDAVAALGMKYDDEKTIDFIEFIYKELAIESYKASINMAIDRGKFKIQSRYLEEGHPFIERILKELDSSYVRKYKEFGRRNIANLTIPPSGSLAILAEITSGIEPVFSLYYTRRRKVEKNHHKIDFVDQNGDCWEEYNVVHPKLKMWYKINYGENIQPIETLSKTQLNKAIEQSPYFKSTANEIQYLNKIKMQGKIQKWIDHSISVTHNLPKDVSVEQVSEIYKMAHEWGCKGCTIYRDGSRSGVLVTEKEEKQEKFKAKNAYQRPKDVLCDIHKTSYKGENYIVLVGMVEDLPYEVFALKQNGYDIPKIKRGYLRKIKKGHYNLLNPNHEIIIEDITSHFERPIEEAITRLISMSLRHGAEIKFTVEQLQKSPTEINDFSKIIARVLKKYIKDGEKINDICPNCGGENTLVYQDGCVTCKACPYSRC